LLLLLLIDGVTLCADAQLALFAPPGATARGTPLIVEARDWLIRRPPRPGAMETGRRRAAEGGAPPMVLLREEEDVEGPATEAERT
jgi:hypothetical protein